MVANLKRRETSWGHQKEKTTVGQVVNGTNLADPTTLALVRPDRNCSTSYFGVQQQRYFMLKFSAEKQ